MTITRSFFEVEVSNASDTVAALFEDLTAAKAYANDCEEISGVRIVSISGPYSVYTRETVWQAYVRTWNIFNNLKGANDV